MSAVLRLLAVKDICVPPTTLGDWRVGLRIDPFGQRLMVPHATSAIRRHLVATLQALQAENLLRQQRGFGKVNSKPEYHYGTERSTVIPSGMRFGFDDLIFCMKECKLLVLLLTCRGFWLDIGRADGFKKAQEIDCVGEHTSLEAVAVSQALRIDRRRLVHLCGVSNQC